MLWIIKIVTTIAGLEVTDTMKVAGTFAEARARADGLILSLPRRDDKIISLSIKLDSRTAYMREYMQRRRATKGGKTAAKTAPP